LAVLLRREGYAMNHKKVFRFYTAENLKVRQKRKKIRSRVRMAPLAVPGKPNERW
jgi:putative transposase